MPRPSPPTLWLFLLFCCSVRVPARQPDLYDETVYGRGPAAAAKDLGNALIIGFSK